MRCQTVFGEPLKRILPLTSRIHIVGIGDDGFKGLTGHARQLIEQAEVLLGTSPLLRKIPATQAERIEIGAGLESLKDTIVKLPKRATVMLARRPSFTG